jgi:hypothetical protein
MEMRLGEDLNDDLFMYERSRFRSAIVAVIVTSMMTTGLGVFVWPILGDMLDSEFNTLQTMAMLLGGAFAAMALTWLYFIIRMITRFYSHLTGLRQRHRRSTLAYVALCIAMSFVISVPIVVVVLNPLA